MATYVQTSPHAHMCGLYYLPTHYIATDTGLTLAEIQAALTHLAGEHFCFYDPATSFVWVCEMAHWRVGTVRVGDNRLASIQRWYASLVPNPYLGKFYDRYGLELQLMERREAPLGGLVAPQAPLAPLGGFSLSNVFIDSINTNTKKKGKGKGESEGKGEGEPKTSYGEFGHVKLTAVEYSKLRNRLGEYLETYINQYDRWADQLTLKKREERKPYNTILNWWDKALIEGKIYAKRESTEQAKARRTKEASERLLARIAAKAGGGLPGGAGRTDDGGLFGETIDISAEECGDGDGTDPE